MVYMNYYLDMHTNEEEPPKMLQKVPTQVEWYGAAYRVQKYGPVYSAVLPQYTARNLII
jgi:hypothetical protein